MNWICWHVGASSDPKLKLIAKRTGASLSQVIHAWVHHLERGAEGDPRGTFGSIDPDEAELATDIPRPLWMAITIAFEDRGLTHDGAIVNFDKRNYGHNSTERVRAFRERQKLKLLPRPETLQLTNETLHETTCTFRNGTDSTAQDKTDSTNKTDSTAAGDMAALSNRILDILGVRSDPRWFGDGGMVAMWLHGGADPEQDIIPTIERVMAKRNGQGAPRSLKYFTDAIAEARDMRLRGLVPPRHGKPGNDYEAIQRKLDEEENARSGTREKT